MLKIGFWKWKDGSQGQLSIYPAEGEIPKFGSGKPMFCKNEADLVYIIQAETWEEGMAIHNLREGYSPYKPGGKPHECPDCHNYYYPSGSGKCFCGYDNDKCDKERFNE